MESVNIFPTTAYLNTPIYAQNNLDKDIIISIDDVGTLVSAHQTVVISAHSKEPGIRVCKYELEGVEHKTTISVEDAIKLGGSKHKTAKIFDEDNKVFVVMEDRTYISGCSYNKENVIFGLSPDNIFYLSHDKYLLNTATDYSVFDVSSYRILFSCKDVVYFNEKYLVCCHNGDNGKYHEVISASTGDVLATFNEDMAVYINHDHKFLFVLDKIRGILYSYSLQDIEKVVTYKDYFLNGANLDANGILLKKCYSNTLCIYYKGYDLRGETPHLIFFDYPCLIIAIGTTECVNTDEIDEFFKTTKDIIDNEKYGDSIFVSINYCILKDIIYKDSEIILSIKKICKGYARTGIKSTTEDLFTKANREATIIEDIDVPEDKPEKAISLPDNVLANSVNGRYSLVREGNTVFIHDLVKDTTVEILKELYDSTSVDDAYFTSDGKSVVFKSNKSVKQILLDDCSILEFNVPANSIVPKSSNGYRAVIKNCTSRVPVWKDPFTLKNIERSDIANYEFISPDGNIIVSNTLYEEEVNFADNVTLNEDKKSKLIHELDLFDDLNSDAIYKNRCKFISNHIDYFNENYKGFINLSQARSNDIKTFTDFILGWRYYVTYRNANCNIAERRIYIGDMSRMQSQQYQYWLNYISFSFDSKYMAIAIRTPNSGNTLLVNCANGDFVKDLRTDPSVHSLQAVWMTAFTKDGYMACYDSNANTYVYNTIDGNLEHLSGKSLVCFSHSGKYIALSNDKYIPAAFSKTNWGHQPANTIYIHLVKDIGTCIKEFSLQGGTIKDQRTPNFCISPSRKVPAVAFSDDDKHLLSVSTDGTIVIRNLHLEHYAG